MALGSLWYLSTEVGWNQGRTSQKFDGWYYLQVRAVSERAWKHILETVSYHCDPEDREPVQSEFDREVDSHYYSIKEKFETIAELLKEWEFCYYRTTVARSKHHMKLKSVSNYSLRELSFGQASLVCFTLMICSFDQPVLHSVWTLEKSCFLSSIIYPQVTLMISF